MKERIQNLIDTIIEGEKLGHENYSLHSLRLLMELATVCDDTSIKGLVEKTVDYIENKKVQIKMLQEERDFHQRKTQEEIMADVFYKTSKFDYKDCMDEDLPNYLYLRAYKYDGKYWLSVQIWESDCENPDSPIFDETYIASKNTILNVAKEGLPIDLDGDTEFVNEMEDE